MFTIDIVLFASYLNSSQRYLNNWMKAACNIGPRVDPGGWSLPDTWHPSFPLCAGESSLPHLFPLSASPLTPLGIGRAWGDLSTPTTTISAAPAESSCAGKCSLSLPLLRGRQVTPAEAGSSSAGVPLPPTPRSARDGNSGKQKRGGNRRARKVPLLTEEGAKSRDERGLPTFRT